MVAGRARIPVTMAATATTRVGVSQSRQVD